MELTGAAMPRRSLGWRQLISPLGLNALRRGWIPDSTHFGATHVSPTSYAASACRRKPV